MKLKEKLLFLARDLVFPGVDVLTRARSSLCRFWKTGPRDVLDAGSGNGYFSWLAYKSGARVVAMNFSAAQVEKSRAFFLEHRKADPARLQFEHVNLYDLPKEERKFDEIICFETLEHIRRDDEVVTQFYRILRDGGVLHLCCPHSLHPINQAEVLDTKETGGHVRSGYTEEEYRRLLEPLGFTLEHVTGQGSPAEVLMEKFFRVLRNNLGDLAAVPFLPLVILIVKFAKLNPPVPFSIYVRAVKPTRLSQSQAAGQPGA